MFWDSLSKFSRRPLSSFRASYFLKPSKRIFNVLTVFSSIRWGPAFTLSYINSILLFAFYSSRPFVFGRVIHTVSELNYWIFFISFWYYSTYFSTSDPFSTALLNFWIAREHWLSMLYPISSLVFLIAFSTTSVQPLPSSKISESWRNCRRKNIDVSSYLV